MTRWLCLAILGLSMSACSSDDDHYAEAHHRPHRPACSEQLTCGTCTPVLGCGWCQYADGSGRCATGPSACGDNFRWNWEPEACPASTAPPTDAGTTTTDATPPVDAPESDTAPSEDAPTSDAAPTDTAPEETAPSDAGATCTAPSVPTGCAQSFGGTLCSAGQYTLGCTGTAKPPAGCAAALTEGGTTHYCCPCD